MIAQRVVEDEDEATSLNAQDARAFLANYSSFAEAMIQANSAMMRLAADDDGGVAERLQDAVETLMRRCDEMLHEMRAPDACGG